MKRDHEPLIYQEIRGLYARGDRVSPPDNFLSKARNIVYSIPGDAIEGNAVKARVRESFELSCGLGSAGVSRFYIYTKSTGNRIIQYSINDGVIYDAGVSILFGPELFGPIGVDFHGVTINDHFYFCYHNRETGLSGGIVYVYDPDLGTTARQAGGDAPALPDVFGVSTSAVNGSIEPGSHIIAVSYITNTGFITAPGLHRIYIAPNPRKKIDITVPVGPAYMVGRIVWMSHVLKNYDGNILHPTLYELYRVDNNTSTLITDTLDAYDTDLEDSADQYINTLPDIPAGTYLTLFDGRMIVCGSYDNPHTLYVSNKNEPENIDNVDGLKTLEKGKGNSGIKTTRPIRGNLAWWKSTMTGVLRPLEDVAPKDWPHDVVDECLGSEVYGVSETHDNSSGLFYDTYLVASVIGLLPFNGSYVDIIKPLTLNIETLWFNILEDGILNTIKTLVDPLNFRVYVLVVDGLGHTRWLMGDFSDGLNADSIKWAEWDFEYSPTVRRDYIDAHIMRNPSLLHRFSAPDKSVTSNSTSLLAIGSIVNAGIPQGFLRRMETNTFTLGYDNLNGLSLTNTNADIDANLAVKVSDPEFRDLHLYSVRLLCSAFEESSNGNYEIQVADESEAIVPPIIDGVIEKPFNVQDRRLEAIISARGGDLSIAAIILYLRIVGQERG